MTQEDISAFQAVVWRYYDRSGRHDLPWRLPESAGVFDPYKIMVSEVMLQQTQVTRVIPKYQLFTAQFPGVRELAGANQGDVLRVWQGLGYNRRAKFLWQAARTIVDDLRGQFPVNETELVKLPGVGKNTAGAIRVYAYNLPATFIETNIRTVFIHHFFAHKTEVNDRDILELVQKALPQDETLTRNWFWALMDYGSYLKQTQGNLNKLSKHYTKQSSFHGSKRQIRGAVIALLSEHSASLLELQQIIADGRLEIVLEELLDEQLINNRGGIYEL